MPITITPEFEAVLKTIAEGKNVFITGKAGTGKSTLLRQFIQDVRNKNILVTAPTGVAALNINGATIHKAFGFRPGQFPDDIKSKRYPSSHIVEATLKILDILVIDEVSMVRAEIFDMIDVALRKVRKTTIPFGGVQLILVGDLLQLPPVVEHKEAKIFREQWKSPYFFDAHSYPDLHVQTIELTKIWRQSDPNFIKLLDQIREGNVTDELLSQLNKCVAAPSSIGNDWTTLTALRKTADKINTEQIHNLNTKLFESIAKITGDVEQNENNFPGSYILLYKRNARVMAVKNDPEGRFVNGSFGIIQNATDKIITVKFDNGNVVRIEKHTWDIRRPAINNGKLSTEIIGSITQFPVILAWAITIHKSQGKTIPKCYINLKYGTQTEGQFYVAISRAIDLNNLRINQKVNKKNIRANNRLIRFLKYDNTGQNNNIKRYAALSFTIIDWGFAHAQYRVGHIHCTVVNDNEIIADFGSWINPQSDIGSLAEEYNIPTFGLAAVPTIREFWPLLLRQIAGAIVIGDHLRFFERALIDQDSDLKSQLGNGYDVNELPHIRITGTTPEDRCHDIVSALNSARSKNKPIGGEPVPSQNATSEGSLYIPGWAPKETIQLDLTRATDTDIAWAALSSSDYSKQSIMMIQNCVNSLRLKAGDYWDDRWREEVSTRVQQVTDGTIFIPEAVHHKVDINELIGPGTRVAFTGRISLNGRALDDDDKLKRLCESIGLEFRNSVSKTKCDVLIARDPSLDSRKIKDATSYKKPIIPFGDFEQWYNFGIKTNVLPFSSKASTLQIEFGCPDSILKPETQVAFSGKIQVNNQHVKRASLEELCKELNLKYRQSVTQSKCDVLIVNDDNLGSNEAQKAKKFKKQFLSADDFSRWVIDHLTADSVWQHKLGLDLNVNQLEDIDSGFGALDENCELEETYNFEDYGFEDYEPEEDEDYDFEDSEDHDEEEYYDLEEDYDLENIDAFDHNNESDAGFDLTTEDNTQDCITRTNLHNQFYSRLQALLTLNSQIHNCLQILLARKTEQDIEATTESKSDPSIHESIASFLDSLDDSDFITRTKSDVGIPQDKASRLNDESSEQMTSLAENKCEDTSRPHPTSKTDNGQRLNNKYILERTNDDSRTNPEVGAINHTPHHDKYNNLKSINESNINCSFSEDNTQHLITRTNINNQIYSYTQVLFVKKANGFDKVRSEDTPDATTTLCNSESASDDAFDASLNGDNTTESTSEASEHQQNNDLEEVFFGPLSPFKNLSTKDEDLKSSEELFLAGKVAWVCKDELEFLDRISAGSNPFFLEREKVNRKGCTAILLLTLFIGWSIVKTIIDNLSTAGYGFLGSALGAITILLFGMLLLCYLVYMFEKPPWDVTDSFEKIENIIGRPALEEFALIYVDLDSIPKIDQDILTAMQHLYANAASHEVSFSPKDWRELTMNVLEATDSYHQTGNIKDAINIACKIKSIQEKIK